MKKLLIASLPRTGAWIETGQPLSRSHGNHRRSLARERGLKQGVRLGRGERADVAPSHGSVD